MPVTNVYVNRRQERALCQDYITLWGRGKVTNGYEIAGEIKARYGVHVDWHTAGDALETRTCEGLAEHAGTGPDRCQQYRVF